MQLNLHLSFNGQCEAAFQMYAECLGGEISFILRHGESPVAAAAPQQHDKIVHATLKLGNQTLTGADVAPEQYAKPQGFAIQLNLDDPREAERIFDTLAAGGRVDFALQQTFWAESYGMVTDRFGTPWELNCGAPAKDN